MELEDLKSLGERAQSVYLQDYTYSDFRPSQDFLEKFKELYEQENQGAFIDLGETGACIKTGSGNTVDFTYSLFNRVNYFNEFTQKYIEYSDLVNDIFRNISSSDRESISNNEHQFRTALVDILEETKPDLSQILDDILKDWKGNLVGDRAFIYNDFIVPISQLKKTFSFDDDDIINIYLFVSDKEWSHTGKSPLRRDGFSSAIMKLMKVVNAKQGVVEDIADLLANNEELVNLLKGTVASTSRRSVNDGKGINRIYYGAPGTGKSYSIDQLVEGQDDYTIRTVFHTDTQNSDFIGCIKPLMENSEISYSFRSGPFTDAVIKALKDPRHHYWLVIEEINRAPAAAVFGEIFQLLDRNQYGESKYKIDVIDPDMLTYINKELEGSSIGNIEKLYIPSNLSFLATMNSSDQAVMPMDTAFKRRWKFKYIPLDFEHKYARGFLHIPDGSGGVAEVEWKEFATAINNILSKNSIPEDRHLGPFFLDNEEMAVDDDECKEILTGKLFMYLWDDVLRHVNRETIFSPDIKTYGQLNKMFNNNENVFSEDFSTLLNKNYPIPAEETRDFPMAAEPSADD